MRKRLAFLLTGEQNLTNYNSCGALCQNKKCQTCDNAMFFRPKRKPCCRLSKEYIKGIKSPLGVTILIGQSARVKSARGQENNLVR